MSQLYQLLRPASRTEKCLNQAWDILDPDEQKIVQKRVDEVFYNDLPFQLEHDKILYLHLFSLLTQLEIFGLQGLLVSLEKLSGNPLQNKLRQHIADEVFHGIVFSKLTYELSAPYAHPPAHDSGMETFMSLLIEEPDLKTSFVLINLVAEGWIEEIFSMVKEHKIAPHIFDIIIKDENRHIEESELYLQMGLPDKAYLRKKLGFLEEELINVMFSQKNYVATFISLFGLNGAIKLINNIDKKYRKSLAKINMKPSKNWQASVKTLPLLIKDIFYDQTNDILIEQTTTRKIFSTQWGDPTHPTQSALFGIQVTPVGFFEKKFPSETITCLFVQAISKTFSDYPELRNYMSNHKIYSPGHSYVGLAIHLPDCDDHLGMIEFKDCHEMNLAELSQQIQQDMKIMAYCYKKTQMLKIEHPYLADIFNKVFTRYGQDTYPELPVTRPTICISNIGPWGYEAAISPLFPSETVKFTLTKIERKQIWNNKKNEFEIQDILPVGMSVDHRIFDGNIPIPSMLQRGFDAVFLNMLQPDQTLPAIREENVQLDEFIQLSEKLLNEDLEFGFRYLFYSSQIWRNHRKKMSLLPKTKGSFSANSKKTGVV